MDSADNLSVSSNAAAACNNREDFNSTSANVFDPSDFGLSNLDFQLDQFEKTWNTSPKLSDAENGLFSPKMDEICPDSTSRDMPTLFDDPILTASHLDFLNAEPLNVEVRENDTTDFDLERMVFGEMNKLDSPKNSEAENQPIYYESSEEDEEMIEVKEEEQEDKDENDRQLLAKIAESVSEIHNYCAPPPVQKQPARKILAAKKFNESPSKAYKKSRRGKKYKKPQQNAWSQNREELKQKMKNKHLYEMPSFEDPELERSRKNALIAKRNRQKQIEKREAMEREVETLRSENNNLKRRNDEVQKRASAAEEALARIAEALKRNSMDGLLKMVTCTKRHPSQRAKEQCSVCSLGN